LLAGRRAVVLDVTELVVDGGWSWPSSDALWVDPVAEVNALARAKAGARLAEWAGFEAEARTDAALDVWQGIDRVAEEIDAAAIVIGSRGLRGLRASLEGSVSRQVEATARRPVLLVPSAS